MEKNITIYDNMGETYDRVTVVFNDTKRVAVGGIGLEYDALGCSETGVGFFMHTTAMKGSHLGKKVKFSDLHSELKDKLDNYFLTDN